MSPLNMTKEQKKELRELDRAEKRAVKELARLDNARKRQVRKAQRECERVLKRAVAQASVEYRRLTVGINKRLAGFEKRRQILLGRLS